MSDPHRELIERGYDRVAEQYLATKDPRDTLISSALEEMTRNLPPGAGVPATLWLAQRGFDVTGVDLSEKQLDPARNPAPGAAFLKADMTGPDFGPECQTENLERGATHGR